MFEIIARMFLMNSIILGMNKAYKVALLNWISKLWQSSMTIIVLCGEFAGTYRGQYCHPVEMMDVYECLKVSVKKTGNNVIG